MKGNGSQKPTLILALFKEKTDSTECVFQPVRCDRCKHWGDDPESGQEDRICLQIVGAYTGQRGEHPLSTFPDFGCALFEEAANVKITEHEMLVTLANMALRMDDLTGHDVLESLNALEHGDVVTEARSREVPETKEPHPLKTRVPARRAMTEFTTEPVGAWRKCQIAFTVPKDAVVVGHELEASDGASILSGSVLESIRPTLRANERYLIRVANGAHEQHVGLTLTLEELP